MSDNKTHYRKVFKSDHLGQADLEDFQEAGSNLVFTIAYVMQEQGAKVAGKKIDANIAYFTESIKPLVLNATNSKVMKQLSGGSPFVEDWKDIPVQLYIDPAVKMKGEIVGGVRISNSKPKMGKPLLTPDNKSKWNNAIAAYKRDGNLDKVLARCEISEDHQAQIKAESDAA